MSISDLPRVVRAHTDDGYRTGLLVIEGRKYASLIWADGSGVRVTRLPWEEKGRYGVLKLKLDPIEYKGRPYPVARAKRFLRAYGRRVGMTKEAKQLLRS